MQTALQVSSSLTGSYRVHADVLDNQNRWSRIMGDRSIGRWAVGSTRTVNASTSTNNLSAQNLVAIGDGKVEDDDDDDLDEPGPPRGMKRQDSYFNPVGQVADSPMLGVEMDIQIGQMTLRSKHLAALPGEVAGNEDVTLIFGDATIQASLVERAQHRQIYRLVGLNHELVFWPTPHTMSPPPFDEFEREYDPSLINDSEKWIVNLFEPLRDAFYVQKSPMDPPTMQFLMPERPLPYGAEVAVLLGLHQVLGGPFKLVYIFRRLKCVHIYEVLSQGREYWFSLHLTTDHRFTLADMQPSTENRRSQLPEWWLRGSGVPYPAGDPRQAPFVASSLESQPVGAASVLVVRDAVHHSNLSGGREVLVPERFLRGLIPQALLDAYLFWKDESQVPRGTSPEQFLVASRGYKRLLGYPVDPEGEFAIIVELKCTSSHNLHPVPFNNPMVIQCTGLPGRTVTITRRPLDKVKAEFEVRQRVASAIEAVKLLTLPTKPKKSQEEIDAAAALRAGGKIIFKVGTEVECDYEGKGEYWPCKIVRVNDNGTYDVEYEKSHKWVGTQRSVDPEVVQARGKQEAKKKGEGVWHWEGMSDSDEDDWRNDSDENVDPEEESKLNQKARLSFAHFDELNLVLEAAGGDEIACVNAISQLARVPGVLPFTDVRKLASAVADTIASQRHEHLTRFSVGMSLETEPDALGPPLLDSTVTADRTDAVDSEDMVLCNLLYAPRRSRLHSIMKVLARIENVGHICAWTRSQPSNVESLCF